MVKAFGYGAGSYELAKTLQEHRCDYLAVAVADEGEELRKEGISIPLIVMNPEFSSFNVLFEKPAGAGSVQFPSARRNDKRDGTQGHHLLSDPYQDRHGNAPFRLPAGRCTGGLPSPERTERRSSSLRILTSRRQRLLYLRRFHKKATGYRSTRVAAELEAGLEYKVIKHILNSAGIERFTDYQMNMVRLGIGLYGVSASGQKGLRNISTLKTTILQIQKRSGRRFHRLQPDELCKARFPHRDYPDRLCRRLGPSFQQWWWRGRD